MKKIVIITGIIIATLVSCSTEDTPTYNQNSKKSTLTNVNHTNICTTCRDSISKDNDSIVKSDPLKPRRD
jgi:hypothetical protein